MTSIDESTEERARLPAPRRASARGRRLVAFAVLPVALMLTTFAVAGPSYSTFSARTSDAANSWTAGSVALQNNSSGSSAQTGAALFSATGLQPGATASKCVTVTSSSTVGTAVALYVSGVTPSGTGSLPSYVSMTVTMGTGSSGTNGDCTGYTPTSTLASNVHLDAMPTTYGSGGTGWTPATPSDTRVFRFTYTVDTTVPNTLQSSTATATFVWETQST